MNRTAKRTTVTQEGGRAIFHLGGTVAGEYVLDDPFKPFFRTLKTPAGHNTVVVSPGDHRHHKGLMYGLRCADLNFWEEAPGSGHCGVHCGVQEILATETMEDGIRQELFWREEHGRLETYRETRAISCRREGDAFVWTWKTRRKALRNHRLVKSEWSLEIADDRKINYHGLGIRLPWVWAHGGDDTRSCNGVDIAGDASTPSKACGTSGPEVTWWGLIDGHWCPPKAFVHMSQPPEQAFTWFVLKGDFPYLAVGPTNGEEREVGKGEVFEESYTIRVGDRR